MIAEIGHFALIIALVTSILQASVPLIATYHAGLNDYMRLAVPLQLLSAAGIIISFACLLVTFITSDFSVALVAQHSHSLKPMLYKISGSWGNHEGSENFAAVLPSNSTISKLSVRFVFISLA